MLTIINGIPMTSMKNTHIVSRLLCVFLAVYSTLCSPQPSEVLFVSNVDVMFNSKSSESANSGFNHDTMTCSFRAASTVWLSGQNSMVGESVSERHVRELLIGSSILLIVQGNELRRNEPCFYLTPMRAFSELS